MPALGFHSFLVYRKTLDEEFSSCKMLTQTELEQSIEKIIDVFHVYSVRVGHFDTLTKMELKLLIQKQLPNYLKVREIHLGSDLDKNKDQQLSFGEFMVLITRVTIATHEHLHHCGEGEGQHQGGLGKGCGGKWLS
uniref:S100 calcium binding protein A12 n=1 Tax=Crocodylus porosus TaxID=8502 RepID=A0A7M4F4R2_CROPO